MTKCTDSDSDTSIHAHTNRGNKLKRRAKYIREGRLDDTGGLAYRKKISHAGYTRNVISTNPPLYDADGDLYSPVESDAERAASPIEDNAFGAVQLEHSLRPLTSAAALPDHPSLSVAYKSKALTQMAGEALEMVRREKEVLWKAKRLLRRFRGDADWVACETFEQEGDAGMLLAEEQEGVESVVPSVTLEPGSTNEEEGGDVVFGNGSGSGDALRENAEGLEGDAMDGVEAMDMALQQATVEAEKTTDVAADADDIVKEELQKQPDNGNSAEENGKTKQNNAIEQTDSEPATALQNPALIDLQHPTEPEAASEQTSTSGKETNTPTIPSHSMTTRARARSPQRSPTPLSRDSTPSSPPQIHPWFHIPPTSLPDRDLGLPAQEAEETRRLLLLYVQKQEHVIRQLTSLYTGLARADRLRKDVYRTCKAEAHLKDDGKGNMVTEMSDGEDWYDVEEWGLTKVELKVGRDGVLGLEKGKDEVEDLGAGEDEGGRRVGGRRRRVGRM